MRITDTTRRVLAYRRQKRDMAAKGFLHLGEIDWRIARGGLWHMKVAEVVIGTDGNSLYYRLEEQDGHPLRPREVANG